MNIKIEK